ncbi:MAG: sugar transferase [Marinosulfonomonas sp.]|nr:sugar transferase [Marinosulfonomonas sp.]
MTVQFDQLDNNLKSASSPVGLVTFPAQTGIYRNYIKRTIDLAVTLLAAPFVLLLVFVLALLVARDGHAPFYWSCRVGKHGRNFRMLKLRTMVPNAEVLLEEYLEANEKARAEWDSNQKLKNDPRITRIGSLLRKTSLDEFPQLWNVLTGDMSLVGPRPMLPQQREIYPCVAYYSIRPGLTGSWQVSDRNESEFTKRAKYDWEYNKNLSFAGDIRILAKTVSVMIKGTGY